MERRSLPPRFTSRRGAPIHSSDHLMKHAFVRREAGGTISVCWWVDRADGVATRALFYVRPGERLFDIVYEEWVKFDGRFVDLEDVKRGRV